MLVTSKEYSTIINYIPNGRRGRMGKTTSRYQAYMLRIWQEQQPGSPATIRFSLEDTQTGRRVGFADWERFIAYLRETSEAGDEPFADAGSTST